MKFNDFKAVESAIAALSPASRAELESCIREDMERVAFRPMPGPQAMAYRSTATVIGYGGAAGGGKSALACGKALMQHRNIALFRRHATELTDLIHQMEALVGQKAELGKYNIWRVPDSQRFPGGRHIEFCSAPHLGDEKKYMGRPHDLLVFDEASNFLEAQVRFLMTWLRSTDPNQRCQLLLTFNPPTTAEGRWILSFFAPWLDPQHPNPAAEGELRWFVRLEGKETEVVSGESFLHKGETVYPQSRTFIAARISDNLFLKDTDYLAQLQALPEPTRSQMLYGDFQAGVEDSAYQVIPTAWVEAAMARWKPRDSRPPMDTLGVDVARGGKDCSVIARRHGSWFDQPIVYEGAQTPDGPAVASRVIEAARDGAAIAIDVIGVGSSPYDFLRNARQWVFGVNVAEKSVARDRSGKLKFANVRSQLWWQLREALEPTSNRGLALPPDPRLRADLCAPTWQVQGDAVQVESREAIVKRLGRSPDWASAYLLALMEYPQPEVLRGSKEPRYGESKPFTKTLKRR